MRTIFEELESNFEQLNQEELTEKYFIDFFSKPQNLENDIYLSREWNKLLIDVKNLIGSQGSQQLTLDKMGQDTFNMVRSFCFVGDIGYDPEDHNTIYGA